MAESDFARADGQVVIADVWPQHNGIDHILDRLGYDWTGLGGSFFGLDVVEYGFNCL